MTGRLLAVLVIAVIVDVIALIDLRYLDRARVRGFRKPAWIAIILVVPVIGAVLWFLLGRGRRALPGVRHPVAPDDDPEFLRRLNEDSAQQERLRRLEQELADLDDDQPER